jgi:branched-chain amino acid transport system substrate-binding protein
MELKTASFESGLEVGEGGLRSIFFQLGWVIAFWVVLGSGCKKKPLNEQSLLSLEKTTSNTFRIGEVGSMTGSDATFGISTHRGISIAVDEVNAQGGVQGRRVELISLDDQGKASEAVLATQKLIHQHQVHAILGEVASTLSIAMAPIAQQSKTPMITPSSINSKVTQQGDYIFRVCFVDSFQSKVMAEFALKNLHAKKVAILQDIKSDYSRDSATIFKQLFKKEGGEVILEQSYSAGDIDFKSQLTAIRSTQPDLVLVPGYYTEIGLIARQAKELGLNAPLLGGDAWDSSKLKEIGGKALDGSYFVGHFSQEGATPEAKQFIQKYQTRFGEIPDSMAALGYDAARILIDSFSRTEQPYSSINLRNSIANTRKYKGVTGSITIDSDRNAIKPAVVFKITQGGTRFQQEWSLVGS